MKLKLILFLLCLLSTQALALQEIMKTYRGIRSLGMGGVTTTTGRYDEALFGNPANHTQNPKWKLTILGLTGEVNSHLISDSAKIKSAQSAAGSAVISTLADKGLVGRNEHTRVTLLAPGFYSPHFLSEKNAVAFGLLINSQANVLLNQNIIVDAQAIVDIGPHFGFARRFLNDQLSVGANLHAGYRLAGDPSLKATNFLAGQKIGLKDIAGQGIGVDFDLGALYHLPIDIPLVNQISLGLSLNNLLQSTYKIAGKELISTVRGTPPNNDRTGNFGVMFDLVDLWILKNNLLALEWQNIGTTRRMASFWKKMHLGWETQLIKNWIALRAGFNQGYIGGGLGFDLPVVKIDLATYGEELGAIAGQVEDRRYALRLSFDI